MDIPQRLIDILDEAAGRRHSKTGSVVTALGYILEEYKKMQEVTKEEIAKWLRDNTSDGENCIKDFEECLKMHPIHEASREDIVTEVYVEVDLFAQMLADWLNNK